MPSLIAVLFYLLALLIHGVPALSVFFPQKMASLYGISAQDQVLMTLLQHRALLFGLIAASCIYAAHIPAARWSVLVGTSTSMAGFMLIVVVRGELGGSLSKIAVVDGLGLIIAAGLAVLLLRAN